MEPWPLATRYATIPPLVIVNIATKKFLIERESRSNHQKRIVAETEAEWEKGLTNPHNILEIQREGRDSISVNFTPFSHTLQISYFESHLKTGYRLTWQEIQDWREAYSILVKRTERLAETIRSDLKSSQLLPEYDRRKHDEDYINYQTQNYPRVLLAFFSAQISPLTW